jgi:hypothetical protein
MREPTLILSTTRVALQQTSQQTGSLTYIVYASDMLLTGSHHFDADPEPAFLFDADPDPASHIDVDPDPASHFDAGPDPNPIS